MRATATNVPVTYMMDMDGRAYSVAGVSGALAADASIGIVTWMLAGILLARFDTKASSLIVEPREMAPAIDFEGDL